MTDAKAMPAAQPSLSIIGAGVAGCAAAWAAAQQGIAVTIYDQSNGFGGVAQIGDHRSLCGLASIDSEQPELLEEQWTSALIAAVATSAPFRRGRVWLWPSNAEALEHGLRQLMAEQGIVCKFNQKITGLEIMSKSEGKIVQALHFTGGDKIPTMACIDASGGSAIARSINLPTRGGGQWGAIRGEVLVDEEFIAAWQGKGRQTLLRRLYAALPNQQQRPALSVEIISAASIQLGMDVPEHSSLEQGLSDWHALVSKVGYTVDRAPQAIAQRDSGGIAGELSLDELFAHSQRGLCWLAWPCEFHDADGVHWRWPAQPRYGFPAAALQPAPDIKNYWAIGKGMAVSPEAIAALRVTGSAWHIGAACGERVATYLKK